MTDFYSNLIEQVNGGAGFGPSSHITITHVERDGARGELAVGSDSLNPHGMVHGGCLTTLADTVAGTAACTRGKLCVTVNSTMNYLAPARGTRIGCVARAQKVGRTLSVFETELTNDEGKTVATGVFTFFVGDSVPSLAVHDGERINKEGTET